MADNRKYYYLKLKEDFFDTDEMKILESMKDGYLYSNILLKLYLKSLSNSGRLMYRNVIPYTPEILATLTGSIYAQILYKISIWIARKKFSVYTIVSKKRGDKMKIVLTDAQTVLDDIVNADVLNRFGEVESFGLLKYEEVAEKIADADIVVCNKTLLDSHTMRLAKNLKYIGLFATGYNNIDLDYCTKNGITVCNAGSYSTNAVAQHTFALILEHFNHTAEYNRFVQDGKWKRSKTFSPFVYPLNELAGKTLGIVGLGNIGKAVAKIANAFDMNVIASSRTPKNIDGIKDVSFDELLETSDIVSVHCPLNPQSENMFDKNAFAKMKQGALFVNTARGGVMVEEDLLEALESGHLGGAAIDTLKVEPMVEDCILMGAKNCIITPHIAWAPVETRERLMGIVSDNIKNFLNGTPTNKVN